MCISIKIGVYITMGVILDSTILNSMIYAKYYLKDDINGERST